MLELRSPYCATEYPSLKLNQKSILSCYPEITLNDLDFLSPTAEKNFSEDDLIQFHNNNLLCFDDNALFYLYLKKNHPDIDNILKDYPHDLDFPYSMRLWNYMIFTGQQGFDLLEPIWSEFERRFRDLLFHANYDFIDKEENLSTCQEIIILRSLRLVRIPDSHTFKIYVRQGEDWEELDHTGDFDFDWVIKSRDYFNENAFFGIEEIYRLISQIVLAEMFNMPKLIYSLQTEYIQKHYPNSYRAITQIVEVFARRLYLYPSNQSKIKNPSAISKYHLAMRLRKIKWVISNFFDPFTCKVFFQNPFNKVLKITDYLNIAQDISAYREDIEFWDNDNPIKTTFLLNAFANNYAAIKNHSILSFDNVLFHKSPSNNMLFWDKRCFNRTFKVMKKSMMQQLFKVHTLREKSFLMWSYWVGYSKYKKMNSHVFCAVVYFLKNLQFTTSKLQHKNFKNFLAKSCLVLDLLYELLLEQWNKNKRLSAFSYECTSVDVMDVVDYIYNAMSDHIRNIEVEDSCNDIKINPTTTLNRLKQLSLDWHQSIWMANFEGAQEDYKHLTAFSHTVKETTFTLIHNNFDLYREGMEQRHCINSYDGRVERGSYVAFKVESTLDRATLGVIVNIDHQDHEEVVRYFFNQCLGRCNTAIKEQTQKDAEVFIQELNQQKFRFFNPSLISQTSEPDYIF